MNDQTNMAQLRYLEELKISLVHAGFEPERIEDQHLPIRWEDHYLCRTSGRGSMLYRQECVDSVRAQDALQSVIDTAKAVLYTGQIGDGKLFVYDIENVVKIRTGEEGFDALQDTQ